MSCGIPPYWNMMDKQFLSNTKIITKGLKEEPEKSGINSEDAVIRQ